MGEENRADISEELQKNGDHPHIAIILAILKVKLLLIYEFTT